MEVKGKIKFIGTTEAVSDKFKKRELVVSTEEQYSQHISLQFTQDKCDVLDKYSIGENVTVNINLKGREWTDKTGAVKYFNTIEGWRIEKQNSSAPSAANVKIEMVEIEQEDNDLPF
jgi:hypothetical protein